MQECSLAHPGVDGQARARGARANDRGGGSTAAYNVSFGVSLMQGDNRPITRSQGVRSTTLPRKTGLPGYAGGAALRRTYTYEEKLAAVRAHLEGGLTATEAMEQYDVRSKSAFFRWCSAYRAEGEQGLAPKRRGRPRKNR